MGGGYYSQVAVNRPEDPMCALLGRPGSVAAAAKPPQKAVLRVRLVDDR